MFPDDPIESNDLSSTYPHIVQKMRTRLKEYKQMAIPAFSPRRNKYSQPKYWGGVWSPGWC